MGGGGSSADILSVGILDADFSSLERSAAGHEPDLVYGGHRRWACKHIGHGR